LDRSRVFTDFEVFLRTPPGPRARRRFIPDDALFLNLAPQKLYFFFSPADPDARIPHGLPGAAACRRPKATTSNDVHAAARNPYDNSLLLKEAMPAAISPAALLAHQPRRTTKKASRYARVLQIVRIEKVRKATELLPDSAETPQLSSNRGLRRGWRNGPFKKKSAMNLWDILGTAITITALVRLVFV